MSELYSSKIVDTHVHLWDPDRHTYSWMKDAPDIDKPFLLDDFRQATKGIDVDKIVFMECDAVHWQSIDEMRWISGLSEIDPRIQGIVSGAPIEKGDAVKGILEELCDDMLLRGIRRVCHAKDSDFCLSPNFIKGVQLLSDYDLSFDICTTGFEHWENALKLVAPCPNVSFMGDHIGIPTFKEGMTDPWRSFITDMAAMPNTVCKFSGCYATNDEISPFIDHVMDSFGTKRVVYGGDWPVSTLSTTYKGWVETASELLESYSASEKEDIFYNNAVSFYKL